MPLLDVRHLSVSLKDQQILSDLSLTIKPGETHVIMGPNGSGKSTLSKVIAGHPSYEVTGGSMKMLGDDITLLSPQERGEKGIFLSFQQPREISGVHFLHFLQTIFREKKLKEWGKTHEEARKEKELRRQIAPRMFKKVLLEKLKEYQLSPDFLERSMNVGFSGGEKKKSEILQMDILRPKLAILDELDSGLDVDALRLLCGKVKKIQEEENMGILLITHYPRILEYLIPSRVHLFLEGNIQKSGGMELAQEIEKMGYMEEK